MHPLSSCVLINSSNQSQHDSSLPILVVNIHQDGKTSLLLLPYLFVKDQQNPDGGKMCS